MLQLVNLFLVIFGVIAVGAGLASWRSHPPMALLLLSLGLALIALAYFSDRRRERRAEERKRTAVQQRIDEFARRPLGSSQTLKLRGGLRNILAGLLLTALGVGVATMASIDIRHDVIPMILGVLLVPPGLLLLLRAWAGLGQPALELDATGFVTPLTGRIAWRDVSGICLRTITQRSGGESFFLLLRVKQFARIAPRIHWTDRLLAMFRMGALAKGVVTVALSGTKEPPAAVYALARQWWKQSTGNDYDWSPLHSDEYNDALKRASAFAARIEEPGAIEASLADPRQMSRDMAQLDSDMALIAGERKRELAKLRWTTGVFVVFMLLVVVWPWLRRWLHL